MPDLVGALTNSYSGSTRYGGDRGSYNSSGTSGRDGRVRENKYNKAPGNKTSQINTTVNKLKNLDISNKNSTGSNPSNSPDKSTPTMGDGRRQRQRGPARGGLHLTKEHSDGKRNSVQR